MAEIRGTDLGRTDCAGASGRSVTEAAVRGPPDEGAAIEPQRQAFAPPYRGQRATRNGTAIVGLIAKQPRYGGDHTFFRATEVDAQRGAVGLQAACVRDETLRRHPGRTGRRPGGPGHGQNRRKCDRFHLGLRLARMR